MIRRYPAASAANGYLTASSKTPQALPVGALADGHARRLLRDGRLKRWRQLWQRYGPSVRSGLLSFVADVARLIRWTTPCRYRGAHRHDSHEPTGAGGPRHNRHGRESGDAGADARRWHARVQPDGGDVHCQPGALWVSALASSVSCSGLLLTGACRCCADVVYPLSFDELSSGEFSEAQAAAGEEDGHRRQQEAGGPAAGLRVAVRTKATTEDGARHALEDYVEGLGALAEVPAGSGRRALGSLNSTLGKAGPAESLRCGELERQQRGALAAQQREIARLRAALAGAEARLLAAAPGADGGAGE